MIAIDSGSSVAFMYAEDISGTRMLRNRIVAQYREFHIMCSEGIRRYVLGYTRGKSKRVNQSMRLGSTLFLQPLP